MPETAERAPSAKRGFVPDDVHRRRRLVALAAACAAVVLVIVLVLALSGGGDAPPANDAAKVVASDALVYLNVSTDPDREGVKKALAVGNRLPSFAALRDALLRRLGTRGRQVDFARDVRPWLGNEATLAVLPAAGQISNSEIVLAVKDRDKAEKFITDAAGTGGSITYHGVKISRYGSVATAFQSGDLLIAPEAVIRASIDRANGKGKSLASNPLFKRAYNGLPTSRALDLYLSRDGVQRLLAPQTGVLGLIGTLLDQPALAAVGASIDARSNKAKLMFKRVLDPGLAKATPRTFAPFDPTLVSAVPKDAVAYLGVAGIDKAAGPLLGLAGGAGINGGGLAQLAQRARASLAKQAGVNLDRDVLSLLRRETAVFVLPGLPTPTLALVAKTPDEGATRQALAKLQVPLARLFTPPAKGAGAAPTFSQQSVGGVDAFQLRLAPTIELDYAVFDGKLVVATSLAGIRRVKQADGSLNDSPAFDSVLSDRPSRVTSLVFLDFGQLLALGQRTGLSQDPAYLAVRGDLNRIRAVGVATSAATNESTAELTISLK